MLSFKPKTNKKIEYSYTENMTLDQKHNIVIDEFLEYEKMIPQLKNKYLNLKNELECLKNSLKIENVKKCKDLKNNIKKLKDKIGKIKKDRTNYYLNNSEYIFKYFEDKKDIHIKNNNVVNKTNKSETNCNKMADFFNLKNKCSDKEDTNYNNDIIHERKSSLKEQEGYIYKYMKNMNDMYFDIDKYIHPNHLCCSCHKGEMIPVACDGVVVCNKCGIQHPFITDCEKPSYKEPPKEVCFYAYQRINHFREILAQFQAKETTQIPNEILENIKFQIKKERIELSELSYQRTKNILKNLGYNKYYEHIAYIKNKLGIKPPIMEQKLEKTLCNLFSEIQNPYSKYCPNERTNFLNYYYTVFKLCELLNQTEYLPLLKQAMIGDRIKRIEQDNIWKKICEEMDWEFIPTE